jgi:hypothetical protein
MVSQNKVRLQVVTLWPDFVITGYAVFLSSNVVFEGVKININGCELKIHLIPLELSDFDIILGMNTTRFNSFTDGIFPLA